MKKLNIPLVVFLAVGFVVTVVGVRFLHAYQVSRSAEKLLTRAESAAQSGDVPEQIRLLGRYLRHRPDDIENLKKLLETSRDQLFTSKDVNMRDIGRLLSGLDKAIRENPEDVDLRRQGYVFASAIGRYGDALDHLEELEVMGDLKSEDRIVLAKCLWQTGNAEDAMKELSELTGFDVATNSFDDDAAVAPDEVNAYALLALIYIRDVGDANDLTVPTMIVSKAIERNPDDVTAYLRRASFYQENVEGKEGKEKSLADIRKALELDSENPMVILAAASTAMALADLDWAKELVDDGLAKHPDRPEMYAKRAEIARAQDDLPQALDLINRGLEKNKMNRELLYRRGSYEVDLGRLDDARTTLERIGNRFDPLRVEILQARILMAEDKYLDASQKLDRLRPMAGSKTRALALINEYLVTCYRKLNQPDKVAALGLDMENAQSRYNQADAYARQGKLDEAIKIYEDLFQNEEALTPAGREAVFNRLFAILIQIERAKPTARRDWTKIDEMGKVLVQKMKLTDAALAQFEIEMLMNKDLTSEARSQAERAVQRFPRNTSFRLLLAKLTNDPDQSMRILDQLEQAIGDSVTLRLTRAEQIVKAQSPDLADRLKSLEANTASFSAEDQSKLLRGLASSYRRAGLYSESIAAWRQLLANDDNSLNIRIIIFDLAYEANDLDSMSEMLDQIATLSGKGSSEWQVAEARRQLWLVNHEPDAALGLDDILDLLQRARVARPDFAPIYMVRAEVLLLQQKNDEAIEAIRTALEKRPGEVTYLQRLADVLVSMNRMDEARPILAQLPDRKKRLNDVVSEIRLLLGHDPAEALKRAKDIFPPTSDDPAVLLHLFEVYLAVNKSEEAIPILQRAIQLDPSKPRPWMLYIRTLAGLGRTDDAKSGIEKLKTTVPAEEQPMLLGQCYSMVRDFELAEKAYQQALERDPDNTVILRNQTLLFIGSNQPGKQLATVKRLVAVDVANSPQAQTDVAWGRRTLAQLTAASGTYSDFLVAIEILEQGAGGVNNLDGADLALWLQLCASRPEAASRGKAVDRLNQIRNDRTLTSGESAVLAFIYHSEGRWPEAKRLMIDILAKNPGNVGYIATYINWLLERKDFSDAAAWIRKLKPDSVEAIRFTSILLTQQGKSQTAAKRLQSMVPKKIDALTAARIMEELGQYDERFYRAAKNQWRGLVKKNPQLIHAYIEYLTRMPKAAGFEESLQLSEKQLSQAVTDQRADLAEFYLNLGLKALRANRKSLPKDSPHYRRIHGWFDLARKAQVTEKSLAWHEVDFYDIRRDYDRLVKLYGDLLKQSDLGDLQRAVVRNNLAFVFAITNKGDQALDVIGDAISQLGPRSDFLDTRGLAYLASGQLENAVADLRNAVSGGQGDAATYFHLALAEYRSGNTAEAIAALQRTEEMGLDQADLSVPEQGLYKRLKKDIEPHLKENELSQVQ